MRRMDDWLDEGGTWFYHVFLMLWLFAVMLTVASFWGLLLAWTSFQPVRPEVVPNLKFLAIGGTAAVAALSGALARIRAHLGGQRGR